MRVERFAYDLPAELIAQEPSADREGARLLVVPREHDASFVHTKVAELAQYIPSAALVVLNDTKVIRARVIGTKEGTGGRAEVFLVRKVDEDGKSQRWHAMARASKTLRPGARVLKDALVIEVEGKSEEGLFIVRITARTGSVDDALATAGQVPLPPYIKRDAHASDEERYQTVFAKSPGAVAAPTAGLHLTHALLARLEAKGCEIATCTLHVGLGTFQPVVVDDLDDHAMHAEYFEIPRALATAVAKARQRDAPVVAIGTTVVRALESAADRDRPGHVRPCAEETRLLVQPGYSFAVVDRLLTNFHLPRSTLLALVCAFAGTERVLDAYRAAVAERYRFFSYGDAMLLERSA
jgi:S-adenosylmethionine:tRNA ribosyltransferase-isomerase